MIEKLKNIPIDMNGELSPVWCKINELCDAVNEMQESQNTYWTDIAEIKKELQTRAENVQPDAESRPENVQKIDIGELAYLQKENSDLKDEVEKLQKQLAEWQNANVSLIKDSAICNTYTHIRWDELCRLREIADKYAEITGHKGVQNE